MDDQTTAPLIEALRSHREMTRRTSEDFGRESLLDGFGGTSRFSGNGHDSFRSQLAFEAADDTNKSPADLSAAEHGNDAETGAGGKPESDGPASGRGDTSSSPSSRQRNHS